MPKTKKNVRTVGSFDDRNSAREHLKSIGSWSAKPGGRQGHTTYVCKEHVACPVEAVVCSHRDLTWAVRVSTCCHATEKQLKARSNAVFTMDFEKSAARSVKYHAPTGKSVRRPRLCHQAPNTSAHACTNHLWQTCVSVRISNAVDDGVL